MNLQDLKVRLKELKIKPNKRLGQNFLINEEMILKIVQQVQKNPSPWVEIGPGLGALTEFFDSKKDQVFLIEKDKKIADYWKKRGFNIFCEEALKFDWNQIPSPFTLFGNLPYQIAGSLLMEMSQLPRPPSQMILMMQKEVAERILSQTHKKSYGLLSVMAQTFWIPRRLFSVGKRNFYPPPKVAGLVLEFISRLPPVPPGLFLQFVKRAFSKRRKRLITQLPEEFLKEGRVFFSEQGWSLNLRAEELSPCQFVKLYKEFARVFKIGQ